MQTTITGPNLDLTYTTSCLMKSLLIGGAVIALGFLIALGVFTYIYLHK